MILLKAYHCIKREPLIVAKEETWLDASSIKRVEVILGLGEGYALSVVRDTGATFVVATFYEHEYGAYNYEDAEKSRARLERLMKGGKYRPRASCGFEYRIVGGGSPE